MESSNHCSIINLLLQGPNRVPLLPHRPAAMGFQPPPMRPQSGVLYMCEPSHVRSVQLPTPARHTLPNTSASHLSSPSPAFHLAHIPPSTRDTGTAPAQQRETGGGVSSNATPAPHSTSSHALHFTRTFIFTWVCFGTVICRVSVSTCDGTYVPSSPTQSLCKTPF